MLRRTAFIGTTAITLSVLAGCASSSTSTVKTAEPAPSSNKHAATAPSPKAQQSTSPVAVAGSASSGPKTCETAHLRLSQGAEEGTAGSSYVTYYLKNVGADSCVMDGYPGFALLREDGSVIQHPATRENLPHHQVKLEPGARAEFVVRTIDQSIPGTGCSTDWKTAQVQVYPPDQTAPIRQPSSVPACNLTVRPVTAG